MATESPPLPSLTKKYHQTSYPSIDPKQPDLSTSGKSILITGGGTGIGRGAALSFARSGISHVALLGRREAPLKDAANLIVQENPATKVHTYPVDLNDRASLDKAIKSFVQNVPSHKIDIILANAGTGTDFAPLDSTPTDWMMRDFAMNVTGNLNLLQLANPHFASDPVIIHTSTGAVHINIPEGVSYNVTKCAAAVMFQHWANEHPNQFVISFHPGLIDTDMARRAIENGLQYNIWDDVSLPSDFTVWAASPRARCLGSGRFMWAHWNVDELEALAKKGYFEKPETMMGPAIPSVGQIGLVGWPPVVKA